MISGKDLPVINNNSKTISIDAESDLPGRIIGKILSIRSSSIRSDFISSSLETILLTLPLRVLISPL